MAKLSPKTAQAMQPVLEKGKADRPRSYLPTPPPSMLRTGQDILDYKPLPSLVLTLQ